MLARGWKKRAVENVEAIELMQRIEGEARDATLDEQHQLMRFVGFGATDLAQSLFPVKEGQYPEGWAAVARRLQAVVTGEEREALARSTQYAHYTPELVVRAMWAGVQRLGFAGGNVLEPGAGTGVFPALLPATLRDTTRFTLVERDPVTARIARLLFPQAQVFADDFTKARLPGDFTLAIGNPPFSQLGVRGEGAAGKRDFSLHDYFLHRSIELLQPGGIGAFVVSRYTMDKTDAAAREAIAAMADLVGAFRLPEGSMRATAGTDVVVDVLFFRKRGTCDEAGNGATWTGLLPAACKGADHVAVNQYWVENPEMVLGAHAITSTRFGPGYTVLPWHPTLSLADALTLAVEDLPAAGGALEVLARDQVGPEVAVRNNAEGGLLREGSYFVDDGPMRQRAAEFRAAADMVEDAAERRKLLWLADKALAEGGPLLQIVGGRFQPVAVRGEAGSLSGIYRKQAEVIRGLVPIRDAVRWVLIEQVAGRSGSYAQGELRQAYEAFVKVHGPIQRTRTTFMTRMRAVVTVDEETGEETTTEKLVESEIRRTPNLTPFQDDPDWPLLAAIEHYDTDTDTATQGPIFDRVVIGAPAEVKIGGPADALAVALNETGFVTMPRIAELLGLDEGGAVEALGSLVYHDPEMECWVTADRYLSGLVRDKLAAARHAETRDKAYARNVEALVAVQPVDLQPSDISARLGASWLPETDIQAFLLERMQATARVFHTAAMGSWTVRFERGDETEINAQWGTRRMDAWKIVEAGLNMKTPKVMDAVGSPITYVVNPVETEAAKEKLRHIKDEFEKWVWLDVERSERLVRLYNDRWNNLVNRVYDGGHMTFPGKAATITPRDHQTRVPWRVLQDGSLYIAHTMGAGKTIEMVLAIMEQRRLGFVKKPMVIVPNHMLNQWSREWMELYPTSRILVADDHNFAGKNRRRFLARAATGDWDAIIITHSAFSFIDVPADFERGMITDQVGDYVRMLTSIDKGDTTSRKKVEKAMEAAKARLEKLKLRTDDLLTLDQIGVDQLVVDEFHEFRKLTFNTKMVGLKGVDPNGSGRAWHMYVASKFIDTLNPGRALIAGSGTPISNTMAELYSLMRFMAEDHLLQRGVEHFDSWAGCFCDTSTSTEIQPSGSYKLVTRFAQFHNIPELVAMFRRVADVILKSDIRVTLNLPTVMTGQRQIVTAPGSQMFRDFQKMLAKRVQLLEQRRGPPSPGDDIILSVIHDGRLAALDMRLPNLLSTMGRLRAAHSKGTVSDEEMDRFDETYQRMRMRPNEPGNKLNAMIAKVHEIWEETRDWRFHDPVLRCEGRLAGATQMIFCDLGTPGGSTRFGVYDWIRDSLVARGVPSRQIAFIHDYASPAKKLRLFQEMNSGHVRVLIGSTQMMGTGVNAQRRLVALHHMDVPWLPAWVEQREGRAERQGNQNAIIRLYAYATTGSMDAQMWQGLERKQRFINAVLKGDKSVRSIEDLEGGQAESFAMAKAIASGDSRLMALAGLTSDVARLRRLKSAHTDEHYGLRRDLRRAEEQVPSFERTLAKMDQDILGREPLGTGEAFRMTVCGQDHADRKKGGSHLLGEVAAMVERRDGEARTMGLYRGFELVSEVIETSDRKAPFVARLYFDTSAGAAWVRGWGGTSGSRLMERLDDVLDGFEKERDSVRKSLDGARRVVASYANRVGAAFVYADELAAKEAELAAIEASLAAPEPAEAPQAEALSA